MRLLHYAEEPVLFRCRHYQQIEPSLAHKPNGLWVSVQGEYDWAWWCREESGWKESLTYVYEVKLRPDANILMIESPEGIDEFHLGYSVETDFEYRARGWASPEFVRSQWPIDWRKVSSDYDGIIIAPYQWSKRTGPIWYYGWDCASGCLWNSHIVESVRRTKE